MMTELIESITDSYVFGIEGFIIIAAIVGVSAFISNARKKVGGSYLTDQIKELDKETYHHFTNITLPELDHKIDHIILSIYGILIIHRENYDGTVLGSEADEEWTFSKKGKKKQRPNPLKKIKGSINVIAEHLDVKEKNIYPIVASSNTAELEIDPSLIKKGKVCQYDQIAETIQTYQTPKLAKTKIAELVEQLQKTE